MIDLIYKLKKLKLWEVSEINKDCDNYDVECGEIKTTVVENKIVKDL